MTLYRALFLTLAGLGLLFQLAATASASPIAATSVAACEEMAAMDGEIHQVPTSPDRPCSEMTLDCVVAMQCVVSVGTLENVDTFAAFPIDHLAALPSPSWELATFSTPPESPPPIIPHA